MSDKAMQRALAMIERQQNTIDRQRMLLARAYLALDTIEPAKRCADVTNAINDLREAVTGECEIPF